MWVQVLVGTLCPLIITNLYCGMYLYIMCWGVTPTLTFTCFYFLTGLNGDMHVKFKTLCDCVQVELPAKQFLSSADIEQTGMLPAKQFYLHFAPLFCSCAVCVCTCACACVFVCARACVHHIHIVLQVLQNKVLEKCDFQLDFNITSYLKIHRSTTVKQKGMK